MGNFVVGGSDVGAAEAESVKPCELSAEPSKFGGSTKPLRPAEGVDPADARFVAANLQHWISNAVRERILLSRSNMPTVLDELTLTSPEMTYDHAMRLQRGEEAMKLSDALVWATRFETVRELLVSVLGDATRSGEKR